MMASVSAAAVFKDSPDLSGTHSVKRQTGDADQSKLLTRLLKRDPETATQGARLHVPSAKAVPHQYLVFRYWKIFNFFGLRQIKANKRHSRNHYNHLLHGRNLAKP